MSDMPIYHQQTGQRREYPHSAAINTPIVASVSRPNQMKYSVLFGTVGHLRHPSLKYRNRETHVTISIAPQPTTTNTANAGCGCLRESSGGNSTAAAIRMTIQPIQTRWPILSLVLLSPSAAILFTVSRFLNNYRARCPSDEGSVPPE